jgi:CDP-glycerol glycerophosphotransferase (TagB/SpsB family)
MKFSPRLLIGLVRLALSPARSDIGFDMASIGEVQFFGGVLREVIKGHPRKSIWVFHHADTFDAFRAMAPDLFEATLQVPHAWLRWPIFRRLALYVTTEQFAPSPPSVYTVALFHGQPSKGVTFRLPEAPGFPDRDALALNDAFFLYGPLHRQALEEHLAIRSAALPAHLSLFDIGHSKSDDVLNGCHDRASYLARIGLDPERKTILYAPAFNEGASLREVGVEILNALCAVPSFNVLAKLPIDCLQPTSDLQATGGINWFDVIGSLEKNSPNFRLVREVEVDPSLAASDVLVTCISSVSFEFLALKRPVIYIDTPKYFREYLPRMFPGLDTSWWSGRTVVNAGREFGPLVSNIPDLMLTIDHVLANPDAYPLQRERLPAYLLYNPGGGSDAAAAQIDVLLRKRVRSLRSVSAAQAYLDFMCGCIPLGRRVRAHARNLLGAKPKAFINRLLKPMGYALVKSDNSDGY